MLDYLAHEAEPAFRPKVQKIIMKRYGLRKQFRDALHNLKRK